MVKIGLIGAGLIGREHARLIRKHPGTILSGIADPAPDARIFADEIGVPYFGDFREMLQVVKPDGAIVAPPNALHLSGGLACIENRIPCLIEKPIADTIPAARALVEACESSSVPVLIGHQRRHSPDIRQAKRAICDGLIGDLVTVTGMWLSDKPDDYFEAGWRRTAGGGPLLINLIHDLDCLRFICGEIHSVKAFKSSKVRGFEVEDTASLTIRFENGALGSFIVSDAVASPFTWDLASGQALYFPHQPENCYFFGGRKGALSVPGMELWNHEGPDKHWQDPFVRRYLPLDGSKAYVNQLDHFIDVIRGSADPLVTARDGMMSLAAVIAAASAADEDRTVTIAEIVS